MRCTFIKTYEPRYHKERTYFLVGTKRRKGAVVLEVAGRQRVTKTDVEAHQIALHCPPQVLNISQQFHSVSAPLMPPGAFCDSSFNLSQAQWYMRLRSLHVEGPCRRLCGLLPLSSAHVCIQILSKPSVLTIHPSFLSTISLRLDSLTKTCEMSLAVRIE